jgi:hypothetical protein
MESSVLWRVVMAVCEGKAERATGLATRYMSTTPRVPSGVGVGVHVCRSGSRKVFASFGRVQRCWVYGELMYLEWRCGGCSHRGSVRLRIGRL